MWIFASERLRAARRRLERLKNGEKRTATSSSAWTSAPPRWPRWWPSSGPTARSRSSAWATMKSKGLKKGVVVNIESTVAGIQRALEEAELMADCKIASAFTGIAGSHIRSFNSTGMVAVKDREVTAIDVERAVETAKAVTHPDRPADPPRAAPGIHHRRPGGRARAGRHVGRAPGSEGAHRHRRGIGGAEHRQVRAALRPGRQRPDPAAACFGACSALGRRARPRRLPGGHRRRQPPTWRSSPMARSATPR